MATREELNIQYSNMCAELGHLVLAKLDLEKTKSDIDAQLKDINSKLDEYRLKRNALAREVPQEPSAIVNPSEPAIVVATPGV